jgi:putative hydrolase of the HAD superfamily
MSLKALIFDLDDTLLVEVASAEAAFLATCQLVTDKYGLDAEAFHQILRRHARQLWYHECPEREYCVRVSVSHWEGLWARYEGDDPCVRALCEWAPFYRLESWTRALAEVDIDDPGFAQHLSDEFPRQRRQRHVLFADVEAVLAQLHGKYTLGLMTNGLSCLQREKIAGSGIGHYFDATVISGDVGQAKPAPPMFHRIMTALDIQPSEALMLGNGMRTDIAGAQAVDIKAVLVDRGDPHGAVEGVIPDLVMDDLMELLDYLGLARV